VAKQRLKFGFLDAILFESTAPKNEDIKLIRLFSTYIIQRAAKLIMPILQLKH
jgi:hypothetical protein